MYRIALHSLLAAAIWLLSPAVGLAQGTYTCVISTSGGHTCDGFNVSVTNTGGNTRTAILNLNASFSWQYLVLRAQTCNATGWTLHVGDSVSNNGGGGDALDANHDAELQALDSTVSVFASDYASGVFTTAAGPPSSGCAVQEYRIFNHYVYVDPNVATSGGEAAWLYWFFDFPPYDEPDNEDWDLSELNRIYLGLNRTYGTASRSGSGLSQLCVFLSTSTSSTASGCPF